MEHPKPSAPCEHDEVNESQIVAEVEVHLENNQNHNESNISDNQTSDEKSASTLSSSVDFSEDPKGHDSSGSHDKEENSNPVPPRIKLQRNNLSFDDNSSALSNVNCKEKIIICIDNCATMYASKFRRTVQSIKETNVFKVLIGAVKQFVMTKSFVNPKHEFSLVILNKEAHLIESFSSREDVIYRLQEVVSSSQADTDDLPEETAEFDMSSLFDMIAEHIELPSKQLPQTPPSYVVRVIFVFGRSKGKLLLNKEKESFQKLTQNPYFFTDCLYIHEEPQEDNSVTDVFLRLCDLDASGRSYILEVSVDSSMSALYNAFAKLGCHPLQRSRQIDNHNFDILDD